jgi:2',3'-cyclic-nucleotide 2'-phosphodiesterase/3'-nucleotidase/5'-nucleotidase
VTLDFLTNPRFDEDGNHVGAGDSYPFPNFNIDASVGETVSDEVYNRINVVELDEVGLSAGDATFANAGTEQDALAEYFLENHATADTAFAMRDVGRSYDTRIIDRAFQPGPVDPESEQILIGDQQAPDTLVGSRGNDFIVAHGGDDMLKGRGGRDYLEGGDGADRLKGGKKSDVLDGGNGADTLTGGRGQDRFILSAGEDVITDFDLQFDHVAIAPNVNVSFKDIDGGMQIFGDGIQTTLEGVSQEDFVARMPIAYI